MTVWTAVDSVKRLGTVKTTTTRDRGDTATVSPVPKKKAPTAKAPMSSLTQCGVLLLSGRPTLSTLINKSFQPISDGCLSKNKKKKKTVSVCENQWYLPRRPDN